MYTHKSRMLAALRGEEVDRLPYAPRLDLWYLANKVAGSLPAQHAGRSQNEIARAEGWPIYFKEADDLMDPSVQPGYVHRGIGLYENKETLYDLVWPKDVAVDVKRVDGLITVRYQTPLGSVESVTHYDETEQRLGISIPQHIEHVIRSPEDYAAVGYIFEHLEVRPNFERYRQWAARLGEDGVTVATGFYGGSPINAIQRDLIDATQFFVHYSDHYKLMTELAARIDILFDKVLAFACASPAEVVLWGANFDDMLTYPPYFEREIVPWVRKIGRTLETAGKRLMCHTDGENQGLMDLIRDSGMHIAESICPAPMTNVTLAEYYRRWSPKLTLFGGIPSTIVMADTSEADFEAYMDELFRAVAPGRRILIGVADQVPPAAVFSRLQRIGERIEREGRLPLAAAVFLPPTPVQAAAPTAPAAVVTLEHDDDFEQVRQDVTGGKHKDIKPHVQALLDRGVSAENILVRGLMHAIAAVGRRMATGEAFIPQVLLAARAMSAGVEVLEPRMVAGGQSQRGKVLIGTVRGDMHDIGKNLVVTLLKGVGYEVRDLGTNVTREKFCDEVAAFQPDVVGLSALLTTTMVEMGEVIRALDQRQLRKHCKVMVGGAPLSEDYARHIGADGFAASAADAVDLVQQLVAARDLTAA